jgi:hypothetical protein
MIFNLTEGFRMTEFGFSLSADTDCNESWTKKCEDNCFVLREDG